MTKMPRTIVSSPNALVSLSRPSRLTRMMDVSEIHVAAATHTAHKFTFNLSTVQSTTDDTSSVHTVLIQDPTSPSVPEQR